MRSELGAQGETQAAELLRSKGYHIIATNVRARFSEADIICRDGDCLVLVEVKTRSTRFADPLQAVGAAKLRRLRRALNLLAAQYPENNVRLDVVTLYWEPDHTPVINHYLNVLE